MDRMGHWMRTGARALAGLALAWGLAGAPAQAALIVDLQPVSICLDDGSSCGAVAFDAGDLQSFWLTEAGITLNILPSRSFDSTTYRTMSDLDEVEDFLLASPSPDPLASTGFGTAPITFWFAVGAATAPTIGLALVNGNRGWIDATLAGIDQTRTLAHELGHTLGLDHNFLGPDNLMAPVALLGTDLLTYALDGFQAGIVQGSSFVRDVPDVSVPAPAALGLFALGLLVTARRRRA